MAKKNLNKVHISQDGKTLLTTIAYKQNMKMCKALDNMISNYPKIINTQVVEFPKSKRRDKRKKLVVDYRQEYWL